MAMSCGVDGPTVGLDTEYLPERYVSDTLTVQRNGFGFNRRTIGEYITLRLGE